MHAVVVTDVPVHAFWSITINNADGYLEPNDLGVNSYNNFVAAVNDDGAFTIHFGSCDDGRVNFIPVSPGWNHTIHLYEPQAEILDSDWPSGFAAVVDHGKMTGQVDLALQKQPLALPQRNGA
ncbi:DUF1214 domain-containing protein [Ruegeria litorea]|uniref:DUF1214 domain-containing protein n=1 Tax=Falsiruegeria litorea TaxID=1280831 RepID=A0ABS5WQE9_9RHOB|nr:DUF1214 domain-containing protein [Falsiruegeria litorea]